MFFLFHDLTSPMMQHPAWEPLVRAMDIVRRRYPKMTVGTLCTLLEIARTQTALLGDRKTMVEVSEALAVPYATLARQTDKLGSGIGGQPGLGLVTKINVAGSNKSKYIDVTPEGYKLLTEIHALFSPEPQSA